MDRPAQAEKNCGGQGTRFISEALAMETANWNLLAALHGHDNVRGGRYNLCEPLKYLPRTWRENKENP